MKNKRLQQYLQQQNAPLHTRAPVWPVEKFHTLPALYHIIALGYPLMQRNALQEAVFAVLAFEWCYAQMNQQKAQTQQSQRFCNLIIQQNYLKGKKKCKFSKKIDPRRWLNGKATPSLPNFTPTPIFSICRRTKRYLATL
jgi:hypothetical protein